MDKLISIIKGKTCFFDMKNNCNIRKEDEK